MKVSIYHELWNSGEYSLLCSYTLKKKSWVVSTQIWVKYGQTQILSYTFYLKF